MDFHVPMQKRAGHSLPRGARGAALALGAKFPAAEVLLLFAIALVALMVSELATWFATAPLTTLVYFLAFLPSALFLVAVFSRPQR